MWAGQRRSARHSAGRTCRARARCIGLVEPVHDGDLQVPPAQSDRVARTVVARAGVAVAARWRRDGVGCGLVVPRGRWPRAAPWGWTGAIATGPLSPGGGAGSGRRTVARAHADDRPGPHADPTAASHRRRRRAECACRRRARPPEDVRRRSDRRPGSSDTHVRTPRPATSATRPPRDRASPIPTEITMIAPIRARAAESPSGRRIEQEDQGGREVDGQQVRLPRQSERLADGCVPTEDTPVAPRDELRHDLQPGHDGVDAAGGDEPRINSDPAPRRAPRRSGLRRRRRPPARSRARGRS